ncbi:hypothetical protein IMG5_000720 [Ichthyophthirius multifiliis]|uniref:Transmembrane protein n=1 Tax=Ichthyophthirius multifiliis TaxID=5932 RepID=G0QIV9_ICHMU|nr:hypothetical protein IMG5_000720 [Ichthyophthirius multifiliis]EGR34844.1 hypothetical protein IMG5_000720 [Ichthyophthirius multifiliis]|eukprot:XP_004040148.1 hypothetical protein IMG5_000720 [Ichthyophthirius multifiliis]
MQFKKIAFLYLNNYILKVNQIKKKKQRKKEKKNKKKKVKIQNQKIKVLIKCFINSLKIIQIKISLMKKIILINILQGYYQKHYKKKTSSVIKNHYNYYQKIQILNSQVIKKKKYRKNFQNYIIKTNNFYQIKKAKNGKKRIKYFKINQFIEFLLIFQIKQNINRLVVYLMDNNSKIILQKTKKYMKLINKKYLVNQSLRQKQKRCNKCKINSKIIKVIIYQIKILAIMIFLIIIIRIYLMLIQIISIQIQTILQLKINSSNSRIVQILKLYKNNNNCFNQTEFKKITNKIQCKIKNIYNKINKITKYLINIKSIIISNNIKIFITLKSFNQMKKSYINKIFCYKNNPNYICYKIQIKINYSNNFLLFKILYKKQTSLMNINIYLIILVILNKNNRIKIKLLNKTNKKVNKTKTKINIKINKKIKKTNQKIKFKYKKIFRKNNNYYKIFYNKPKLNQCNYYNNKIFNNNNKIKYIHYKININFQKIVFVFKQLNLNLFYNNKIQILYIAHMKIASNNIMIYV